MHCRNSVEYSYLKCQVYKILGFDEVIQYDIALLIYKCQTLFPLISMGLINCFNVPIQCNEAVYPLLHCIRSDLIVQ